MYIYGAKKPYKDYLIEKSYLQDYENKMEVLINEQTRKLIISNTALQEKNTWAIEKLNKNTNENLEKLFIETNNTNKMISQLNSTIYWGYNYIGELLDKVNYYLDEIVHHLKTPIQTKAYEYYEIASDAFEDKLFPECLKYLEKAIELYNMEWRFYYMKGLIEQGFIGCDTDLIDLDKAEESFLLSARYSMANSSITASTSYLSASWAAYCNGRLNYAKKHLKCAKDKNPDNGEIYYRLAKISADENNEEDAIKNLKIAFVYSVQFCIKAGGDESFNKYRKKVNSLIEELKDELSKKSEKILQEVNAINQEIFKTISSFSEIRNSFDYSIILKKVIDLNEIFERDSIYDYKCIIKNHPVLTKNIIEFIEELEKKAEILKSQKKEEYDEKKSKQNYLRRTPKYEGFSVLVLWIILANIIPWIISLASPHDEYLIGEFTFIVPVVAQVWSIILTYQFLINDFSNYNTQTPYYIGQTMFFLLVFLIIWAIYWVLKDKKTRENAYKMLKEISINENSDLIKFDEFAKKLKAIKNQLNK